MTDQLPTIDVARIAARWMAFVDSFIIGLQAGAEFPLLTSATTMGTVVGVYLNNKSSYVVVTTRGLSVLFNGHQSFIAYTDISEITEPSSDDQDLDLLVESIDASGKTEGLDVRSYLIPILGVTDDVPDIVEFYGFLSEVVREVHVVPVGLQAVSSQLELVAYLRTECQWKDYVDALVRNLETNLTAEALDDLQIDRTLLRRADFWRAVALIVSAPQVQE